MYWKLPVETPWVNPADADAQLRMQGGEKKQLVFTVTSLL